jgi:hypothetical protein
MFKSKSILKTRKKFFHNINYTMNSELLILFLILLLALVLCSFLGGSKCREGMENESSSNQMFTSSNGSTAQLQTDANGNKTLIITNSDGTITTFVYTTTNTYTGPSGETATVVTTSNGLTAIQVKDQQGTVVLTLTNNANTGVTRAISQNGMTKISDSTDATYNHYDQTYYPTIYYGPNGGTARVIQTPNNNTIVTTSKNGTTEIYYINNNPNNVNVKSYYGPNGGSAQVVTGDDGKKAVEITTPNGSKIFYYSNNVYVEQGEDDTINQYSSDTNTTGSDYNSAFTTSTTYPSSQVNTVTGPAGNTYSTYDSSAYTNSLPQGIPKSMIPPGQEDLYILKSEIVPPVCPRCPDPILQCPENNDVTKCPPCPPCARCPEPAFDCKKVPNYSAFNQNYLPVPVLNDFSTFGM